MDLLPIMLRARGDVPLNKFLSLQVATQRNPNKAIAIITAKCGFNRNTKSEVLYGPRDLGGVDFLHLAVQQGICQVTYFLRHWRIQSQVGKLLKYTMAWLHPFVGMSYSVLEQVNAPLPHLESKWIRSLRNFLVSISASLHLDNPCVPPPQREHDKYLMAMIIDSKWFTPLEIRKLNYCRFYLQEAVTLADTSKPNGHEFDPCFLKGTSSLYSGSTQWHTINQGRAMAYNKPRSTFQERMETVANGKSNLERPARQIIPTP